MRFTVHGVHSDVAEPANHLIACGGVIEGAVDRGGREVAANAVDIDRPQRPGWVKDSEIQRVGRVGHHSGALLGVNLEPTAKVGGSDLTGLPHLSVHLQRSAARQRQPQAHL